MTVFPIYVQIENCVVAGQGGRAVANSIQCPYVHRHRKQHGIGIDLNNNPEVDSAACGHNKAERGMREREEKKEKFYFFIQQKKVPEGGRRGGGM